MKKYVKKMVAVAMAASMVMPMSCMNAFAVDGTSNDTEASTNVKYTVTEEYTWSVPTDITFTKDEITITADQDDGATQKVKVTKNVIPVGKKLQITAKGSGTSNAFTITATNNGSAQTLPYSIKAGDNAAAAVEVVTGGTVLEVAAGTNTGAAVLVFELTQDATEQAGEYTGTVTYTASIQ